MNTQAKPNVLKKISSSMSCVGMRRWKLKLKNRFSVSDVDILVNLMDTRIKLNTLEKLVALANEVLVGHIDRDTFETDFKAVELEHNKRTYEQRNQMIIDMLCKLGILV